MSSTVREIRAALKQRLTNRTDCGEAVSTNRADQVWARSLPAIVIYTKSESDERVEVMPPSYDCKLQVIVEVLAQDDSGLPLDDVMDEIASQVRAAIFPDPRLQAELPGVVQDGKLVSYEVQVEAGGERLIAGGRLTFEFLYQEEAPEGDIGELAPLKTIGTEWSLDASEQPPL